MGGEVTLPQGENAVQAPNRANTCAIIVTYHPGEQIEHLVETIAPQVAAFILVDNNSGSGTTTHLRELCARRGGFLLENAESRGVAGALNQGLRRAAQMESIEWFLFFDQDTQPDAAIVEGMAAVWHDYPAPAMIGLIGCNYVDRMEGLLETPIPEGAHRGWFEIDFVITSGSALPRHVYDRVGGMREELFIDLVDTEFCLRLIASGYRILKTYAPLFAHTVGAKSPHRLLYKTIATTNHSPARRYFMMRNSVLLAKEQLRAQPRWSLYILRRRAKNFVFVCLFEKNRPAKIAAMLRGTWDGLLSRTHYNPLR